MVKKTKAGKKKAAKGKVNRKIKPKKKAAKKKAAKKKAAKKKQVHSKVNREQQKKPVGAPVKYNTSFDGRAERYIARFGMNLSEMAKEFEVSVALVYRWMKAHETFAAAVEAGRSLMASEIEHNLRKMAMPHDEVTDEYETTACTDEETGDIAFSKTEGKHKIKRGVVNTTAALRILQAHDKRYRPNVKLDADDAIDGLSKLLGEIDGTEKGLPPGS